MTSEKEQTPETRHRLGRKPTYKERTRISIYMDRPQRDAAEACAKNARMPLSDWIVGIVQAELDRNEKKKSKEMQKKEIKMDE